MRVLIADQVRFRFRLDFDKDLSVLDARRQNRERPPGRTCEHFALSAELTPMARADKIALVVFPNDIAAQMRTFRRIDRYVVSLGHDPDIL